MSPACQSSVGCIDAHVPVHPACTNLYRWAESDAKFVRSLASGGDSLRSSGMSPAVMDSFSCRQKFLRSYTFSKKETVPEKTVKCLGKAKVRAADLPCFHYQSCGESLLKPFTVMSRGKKYKSMSPKKKGRSMLRWIFYRLLSCTSSFDVADVNSAVHAI